MTTLQTLVARDGIPATALNPTIFGLLVALLSLSIVAVLASIAIILLRHFRPRPTPPSAKHLLPMHEHHPATVAVLSPATAAPPSAKRGHRRTISVTTVPCHHDLARGAAPQTLLAGPDGCLTSPPAHDPVALPEIHITFPEEDRDVNEKRHSGRVVVVRISDNGGIGLAPYQEPGDALHGAAGDALPAYSEFMSLDIEKLGGLREKKDKLWA